MELNKDYTITKIPKKSGGMRTIYVPTEETKKKQRKILKENENDIERNIQYLETIIYNNKHIITGFRKGYSNVISARYHIGYKTTIMLDIKDYFNSISETTLRKGSQTLRQLNLEINPSLHTFMLDYINEIFVFEDNEFVLKQGFPTSPIIANIYTISYIAPLVKYIIENILSIEDYIVTYYADDIAISLNIDKDYDIINLLIDRIAGMLEYNLGLEINRKKTRIKYTRNGFRRILGIMVGKDIIKPPRRLKMKLRAIKHQQRNLEQQRGLESYFNSI